MKLVAAEMEEVGKKDREGVVFDISTCSTIIVEMPAVCAESHYSFLVALDLVGFRRYVRGGYDSSSTSASILPAFTAATKAA